jgi:hypothetical protein
MRESVIEQYLVDQVKACGGMAPKFKSPQRRNVPDRIVLLPGGVLHFVELKANGERPTPAQQREHERLRELGFAVYVLDSKEVVDAYVMGESS